MWPLREWVVCLLFTLLFACVLLWAQDDGPRISGLNHEPPVAKSLSGPVAVCTTEELEDLFALVKQQDRTEDMEALGVVAHLVYEDAALRQYVKFTFGTTVFIQSKGHKNSEGLDEIDYWIVIAGRDGHLVYARHDQIVEDNATVVTWKDLPNGDKEAVSVARGIIDRFLGRLTAI